MEYFKAIFKNENLIIRDIQESDIEPLLKYWHESDPEYLWSLGVDIEKLTTKEATRARLLSAINQDAKESDHATLIVEINGEVVAYTNFHPEREGEGYMHAHILEERFRSSGIGSFVFIPVVDVIFQQMKLKRLLFEVSPTNKRINGLIQKFGFQPEERYVENPNGMARPGMFNVYKIPKEDFVRAKGALRHN